MSYPITTSKWLKENIEHPDLIILDASQVGNKSGLEPKFEGIQIIGARIFDIKNDFSDTASPFPNTLIDAQQFEIACRKIGVKKSSKIVVYDNLGIFTSPRVWWMFKTMGHENISILDGGLPDWIDQDHPTEKIKENEYNSGDFEATFSPENVRDFDFIKTNLNNKNYQVIDARSEKRFSGTIPEPREGLRSGNIPNSLNMPFQKVLRNGKFKDKVELTKLFSSFDLTNQPIVFTCGSGITACILLLASELVLENKTSVYDGSWTEWGHLFISE